MPHTKVIRIAFWIGAITDALAFILMIMPGWGEMLLAGRERVVPMEERYAWNTGAALMLGWTFLLVWADRKPVERRFVAVLTVVPVISGIMLAIIIAIANGVIPFGRMLPLLIHLTFVMTILTVG